MQFDFFDNQNSEPDLLESLFEAYFDSRRNKRNTINALQFEKHLEHNIFVLYYEIQSDLYRPTKSIAFVLDKPVKREIFAADFRDRIVYHFIINKLNPYFERVFIEDSYACRMGKGTHYGIKRISNFIGVCSENYMKDCYILKLDIQGFFLNINKDILYDSLHAFVLKEYKFKDISLLLSLCRKVIYNDPTQNCIIKGRKSDWEGLPKSKSLFFSKAQSVLPIGNLTSQILANFYLDRFDHFIRDELKIKHYGRYVDDFVIVHPDRHYLQEIVAKIEYYLSSHLRLNLHPKKKYLQHYSKGVPFLEVIIKPHRMYIGNRTKSNWYRAIQSQNEIAHHHRPTKEEQQKFQSCMNSYLGIHKHYNTYRLRRKMLWKNLSPYWWNLVYVSGGYSKFVLKTRICSGK